MGKKSKSWTPIFVTQSSDSVRVGFARASSIQDSASPWHDFFFGVPSHPKKNPKLHTNRRS